MAKTKQVGMDREQGACDRTAKMNRHDFIEYVARQNGLSPKTVAMAYRIIMSGIQEVVQDGTELSLMGFGKFYLAVHKGHPTQFKPVADSIEDYVVFKFSPSNVLNRRIRGVVSASDVMRQPEAAGV